MTVSIDGNFGLVRKRNAGSSSSSSGIDGGFFIDDATVEDFVTHYGNDKEKEKVRTEHLCVTEHSN